MNILTQMNRPFVLSGIAVGGLGLLIACSSSVTAPGAGSGGSIDQDCYDECIAKGSAPDVCEKYCSDTKGTGGKGTGGKSSSGTTSSGTGGAGGEGGMFDPDIQKPCVMCWEDEAENGVCAEQWWACEASLACRVLRDCPWQCKDASCVAECDSVVPDGVPLLTALVECIVCNQGPCYDECVGSSYPHYCD